MDGHSVAKQWLGKETSTTERLFSMGSAPRPLLCNGSVNTFQQQRLCFLWGPCKGAFLKTNGATVLSSEFSVEDSHGKFVEA
jgi:hypothetical protein